MKLLVFLADIFLQGGEGVLTKSNIYSLVKTGTSKLKLEGGAIKIQVEFPDKI